MTGFLPNEPLAFRHLTRPSALQLADRHVVERHVVRRAAVQCQAVVVDDLDALLGRSGLDRSTGCRVEVHEQEHLRAVRDGGISLCLLRLRTVLRVHDGGLEPSRRQGLLQIWRVLRLPPHRRLRVGKQHPDVDRGLGARGVGEGSRGGRHHGCGGCESRQRDQLLHSDTSFREDPDVGSRRERYSARQTKSTRWNN